MFNFIYPWDISLLYFIKHHFSSIFMNNLSIAINFLGNWGLVWIILSLALILNKKYRKIGIMMLFSIALCGLLGEGIIKHVVKRPRPFLYIEGINVLIKKPLSYSFPSGHTSLSFAAATIVFYFNKKIGIVAIIIAMIFGISRMYLFVHFPSDVLGGAILGIISALAVIFICKKSPFLFKA